MYSEHTVFNRLIAVLILAVPLGALLVESWASRLVGVLAAIGIVLIVKSKYFSTPNLTHKIRLSRDVKLLFFAVTVFGSVALLSWLASDMNYDGWRKLGRYLRFLLVIPLVWLFLSIKLKQSLFWYGVSIAALFLAFYTAYEIFFSSAANIRASGATNPILFGNLSLVLGAISLAGIEYFFQKRRWLIALPVLAFLAGLFVSALSMSRGGWLAVPVLLLICYWYFFCHQKYLKLHYRAGIIVITVSLIIFAYLTPQTGVKQRVNHAAQNIERYLDVNQGGRNTSIGLRFEMWKGAWLMFNEHPVLGAGVGNFKLSMKQYVQEGILYPGVVEFSHPHNEYLSILANRGLLGFFSLLLIFLIPLRFFLKALDHESTKVKSFGLSGLLLVLSYMIFGITEAIFDRGLFIVMYVFFVSLIYALIIHLSRGTIKGQRNKTVSVIIITKDEEDRIEACLQSVKNIADEIIVLDSGSKDRTVEIAKRYADYVEVTDWPGYGLQKQRALEKASCDWVLSIDADERLDRQLSSEINHVLSTDNGIGAYKLPWAVTIHGKRLDFGRSGRAPLRLFKREGVRFSDAQVHEAILLPEGTKVKTLEGRLLHFTQRDYGTAIAKSAKYAWLSSQKKYQEKSSGGSLFYAACRAILTFVHIYIIRLGFLDGRVGFLMAALYTQTNFNKYVGLWSLNQDC